MPSTQPCRSHFPCCIQTFQCDCLVFNHASVHSLSPIVLQANLINPLHPQTDTRGSYLGFSLGLKEKGVDILLISFQGKDFFNIVSILFMEILAFEYQRVKSYLCLSHYPQKALDLPQD